MAEQTLVKNIGETIRVTIDVKDMQASTFVGFRVVYPAALMVPVTAGSGNAVQFEDGDVFAFAEQDVDVIANDQSLNDQYFVYVSKAMKSGAPVALASGSVITLLFIALAAGVGSIKITERKYWQIVSGQTQEYPSTAEDMALTLQEQVVASFSIRVA